MHHPGRRCINADTPLEASPARSRHAPGAPTCSSSSTSVRRALAASRAACLAAAPLRAWSSRACARTSASIAFCKQEQRHAAGAAVSGGGGRQSGCTAASARRPLANLRTISTIARRLMGFQSDGRVMGALKLRLVRSACLVAIFCVVKDPLRARKLRRQEQAPRHRPKPLSACPRPSTACEMRKCVTKSVQLTRA